MKNIPKELKEKNQWVLFKAIPPKEKDGHWGKAMIDPNTGDYAKSNDPSTWSSYENALMVANQDKEYGLAFVLTEGIVFIDVDHCLDKEGNPNELASSIMEDFKGTYVEKSVSGTGIHVLAKGKLMEGYKHRNDQIGLEMYDTKRFMCITGNSIGKAMPIEERQPQIFQTSIKHLKTTVENHTAFPNLMTRSDQEIISLIERSRIASRFESLMRGDLSGYPSHSNADYALVNYIGFYTQDENQIDRIFRSSGLMREKWDRRVGDITYGQFTIRNALKSIGHTFHENQPTL